MAIWGRKPEGTKKNASFVASAPEIQISDGAYNGSDCQEKGKSTTMASRANGRHDGVCRFVRATSQTGQMGGPQRARLPGIAFAWRARTV